MVTSVNAGSLAALLAQENALANRSAQTNASTSVGGSSDSSQDPAVVYSGSQDAPNVSAILSVQDSLNRAASISDVGLSAGNTITDLLALMRDKVATAQTASPDQQSGLNADYQQLLKTVDQIANSASFQGVTMLNGQGSGDLTFNADPNSNATVSLSPLDLTSAGLGLSGTGIAGSSEDLASLLDQIDSATNAATSQLSQLGSQSAQIQAHLGVVSQLQSSLAGATSPDLNADTARLQALQVQQMLSDQGASVANQAPQALLSLFRTS